MEVTQQSVEIKDKNGMQTTKQWHQQIRSCYLRTFGQGGLAALDMNQHPDFKESRRLGVLTNICRAPINCESTNKHIKHCESAADDNSMELMGQTACHARSWLKTPHAREQGKGKLRCMVGTG